MDTTLIYLDHAATTPVRPEARAAMEPYLGPRFGNAASGHAAGRAARAALEEARERVAACVGARPMEIVFTSGGTEADNLAVLGHWRATGSAMVVSAIEHSAVREAAAQAAREGARLTTIAVREDGLVDVDALSEALDSGPALVSVMWGNNEVGTLQPMEAIAEACRTAGATFHTDAVQAVGHVPVSVADAGCDLLAISAHKFGGPHGMGVLYVRRGTPLAPLIRGGGHENGLRAGTSNVAGAVGLAAALEAATADLAAEHSRLAGLRDRLQAALLATVDGLHVIAGAAPRLPHILSVGVDATAPDVLLPSLDLAGLAVSAGSACRTGAAAPSPVLVAMGVEHDAFIRFSLGWITTEHDIDAAAVAFAEVIGRVRALETAS
jgi:cysteine desulfurase